MLQVNRAELFTDFHSRQTRGCGFIFYRDQKSAEDAIAAMHGAYTFPGAFFVVVVVGC